MALLAGLAVASPLDPLVASTALAEGNVEALDLCGGLAGQTKSTCQDAFALLTTRPHLPDADITVFGQASPDHWLVEYRSGKTDPQACPRLGPLVVPTGMKVRAIVSADAQVYHWSVPGLKIDQSLVPGRVEEFWIPTQRAGIFEGEVLRDGGGSPVEADGGIHVVTPEEYLAWQASEDVKPCQ